MVYLVTFAPLFWTQVQYVTSLQAIPISLSRLYRETHFVLTFEIPFQPPI
jgi:hypothetical protein